MGNILELFEYGFFIRALLAAILTSISCGIIGTYIVSRRLVFISGGITHASFGGIGLAWFLGLNPIAGAAVFGVLSAFGVEFFTKRSEIREDSAIGILWSFGMALGIIFIFLTPGYAPNLMSYLFGSILTVTQLDIYLMLALAILIGLVFILLADVIIISAFDEEYARTRKLPVSIIKYSMMAFIALTIVLSIRVVGIILVLSMLTIPQSTANLFTRSFKQMAWLSILIAMLGSGSGLIISYFMNIPSGASIIFTLVLIFALAKSGVSIAQKTRLKKKLEA
ncbi:MAG: metal ABC transporter permease [Bacteroidales bacterium]|nr:metal ABC transporter permease [Bacteroidales bacterium]